MVMVWFTSTTDEDECLAPSALHDECPCSQSCSEAIGKEGLTPE